MCSQFTGPEIECFHAIKRAFDPEARLNPGKAVPTLARCADYGALRVHGGRLPHAHPAALLKAWAVTTPRMSSLRSSAMHAPRADLCGSRAATRKSFFGRPVRAQPLLTTCHRGIVNYDPAELVLTARAGTPLVEIERALEQTGQRLPFDPPRFGEAATLGGTIAAGLAGPARAAFGPVRDYVPRLPSADRRRARAQVRRRGYEETSRGTTCRG
jgi:hypothetical protein